ncbi:MBL fold metallo-hydrolase [Mesorhizobium xinjiangense]|uniref:MBL fold metallo-hydrolase n=1 Tax=Mesorhizobium xinjiangense TaxID=2678685 RepID=UPI001F45781C|nr:MBL fold metallo-hydrolase [Mesorhizobium xinjiangense]
MLISRRDLVKAAIALPLAGLVAPAARAIGRLTAGDAEIIVVGDGHMSLPLDFVFPDLPQEELKALLAESGMPSGGYNPDCNVTFLRSGDRLAVFDVGAGPNFMQTTGRLVENLEAAEIDPADVTDVIFTHAHPDHLWGVLDDFDELVFPNAGYRMAEAEWEFWRADDTLEKMPEERKSFVVGAQNRLEVIGEKITLFKPGAEVFPAVEAVDTAGHTPGHVSFMVYGGAEPVLVAGDAITNLASFVRPELRAGADQEPDLAAAARAKLLDRLAVEKARLIGFHLPHPGVGTVERQAGAYRFAAA